MTGLKDLRFLERQKFFDGQRLFASDLQELESFHREMRWLHNRSLHQPGIGNGYAITGVKGERIVTVGPGYAIDAEGREIVLLEERVLQVPPVAGEPDGKPATFDLTVAYPSDADLEEAETRASVCTDRGTVRLREEPVFCWVRLQETEAGTFVAVDGRLKADVEQGLRLVIGRVEVLHCRLHSTVSLEQRRSARPSFQPYIACGSHQPESWEVVWYDRDEVRQSIAEALRQAFVVNGQSEISAARLLGSLILSVLGTGGGGGDPAPTAAIVLPFGLRAVVTTGPAGFQTTPGYSVRIDGRRIAAIDLSHEEVIVIG